MPTPSPLLLGKSRIEALSDGVFSITMTLLVLKLEVPPVMHHASNEDMRDTILAMWPAFATYVITFIIAGGYWFLHHLSFHFIRHVSGALLWINLLFLMLVSLLPFSAGLMNHLLIHPVSWVFYFGNHLAIAALLNAHWFSARAHCLVDPSDPHVRRLTFRMLGTGALFLCCLILAIFVPLWSWIPLPLFLIGGLIFEASVKTVEASAKTV